MQVVEGPGVSARGTHHAASLDPDTLAALDRCELARQCLSGLAFLHDLGIVVRVAFVFYFETIICYNWGWREPGLFYPIMTVAASRHQAAQCAAI